MCGHLFHSECLLDWIKLKESCPNCKKEFDKKAISEFEKKQRENIVVEKSKLKEGQENNKASHKLQVGSIPVNLADPRESAALLVSDMSRPVPPAPSPIVRISRANFNPPPTGQLSTPHSTTLHVSALALNETNPVRSRARLPSNLSLSRGFAARHTTRPISLEQAIPRPTTSSQQQAGTLPPLNTTSQKPDPSREVEQDIVDINIG